MWATLRGIARRRRVRKVERAEILVAIPDSSVMNPDGQEEIMTRPDQSPKPDRGAVLTKATVRAAERLGVSDSDLAKIVGVPEGVIMKWRRREDALREGSEQFRAAALFLRAYRSLNAIVGGTSGSRGLG